MARTMMRLHTVLLIAVFVMIGFRTTAAQPGTPDTLRVGDPRVDGSFIEAFSVTWRATSWDSAGRTRAPNLVEETVEVVRSEGDADLLKFIQTWRDSLGEISFITARVADRRSMAYRAFHTGRTPTGLGRLDINGARVHGFYAPSPERPLLNYSLVLDETPFASFAGLLFSAFAHDAGLSGVFPGFGWGGSTNPNLVWQEYRVVGRERVELVGSNGIDAWRVETTRSPGSETIYWVTKQPPYFVQAESHSANGSGSRFEVVNWR